MQSIVYPFGQQTVTLAANEKIAVYTMGTADIKQLLSFPNYPAALKDVAVVSAGVQYVSAAFTSGATIIVNAGPAPVYYEVGTSPVVGSTINTRIQSSPSTLNTTGTLTISMLQNGIITSTTAAAVTGTLDTGAIIEAASDYAVDDAFDWTIINTGPNTFTVAAAASGHTCVGTLTVATATSARFRTRKTATETFVTYRID